MAKPKRKKTYPLPVPPSTPEQGWLLRMIAKALRQIADELTRIAGPQIKPPGR